MNSKSFTNDDIFQKNLTYYTPKHGSPTTPLRVPECFSLYVCPPSCARRTGLRSIANGELRHSAFLMLSAADVISGDYEDKISGAVGELLALYRRCGREPPKAMALYVSCIDDFLGTDEEALTAGLQEQYPGLVFAVCHINPVNDGKGTPRGMLLYDRLFGFLRERTCEEPSVNLIGNYVPIYPRSEFYSVLQALGIRKCNDILEMKTFEEYQHMANSRLNLVMMVMGRMAGERMRERFGIPALYLPPSYDLETVLKNYRLLADTLGRPLPPESFQKELREAEEAVRHAQRVIGELPVVVDTYGTRNPFSLARTLCGYGFRVRAVMAAHAKENDREDMEYLLQHHPETEIIRGLDQRVISGYHLPQELLAIGYDAAYLTRARHFADLRHDESFYGFQGIAKLMRMMEEAVRHETVWDREGNGTWQN